MWWSYYIMYGQWRLKLYTHHLAPNFKYFGKRWYLARDIYRSNSDGHVYQTVEKISFNFFKSFANMEVLYREKQYFNFEKVKKTFEINFLYQYKYFNMCLTFSLFFLFINGLNFILRGKSNITLKETLFIRIAEIPSYYNEKRST
jgi:hypothetical protein